MLINEKLTKQQYSKIENDIAHYFLEHPEFLTQSSRQIAKILAISPSTLIRFCQKLGYLGLDDLKKEYQAEKNYLDQTTHNIDPNYPFLSNDSMQKKANSLESLYHDYIKQTHDLLNHDDLQKALQLLRQANTVYVYSSGVQMDIAQDFKEKLLKLGKQCILENKVDQLFYQISFHNKDTCFILISYSGETELTLKLAKKVYQVHIPIIAISAYGDNTLTKLATTKLSLASKENLINNVGPFGINISLLYLLDLLYINSFNQNNTTLLNKRIDIAKEFQTKRHSTNPILKDNSV